MDGIVLGLDGIILGVVGLLFVAGLVGAGTSYWKWRSAQPGRSRKTERIPLAFPIDVPASRQARAPDTGGWRAGASVVSPSAIPSAPPGVSPEPQMERKIAPEPAYSGPRKDAGATVGSTVAQTARKKTAPEPISLDEPPPQDVPTRRVGRAKPKDQSGAVPAAHPTPPRPASKPVEKVAASPALSTPASAYTVEDLAADNIHVVEGKTIVFHRPSPGTMRLLPGRLEVEEGEDSPAEIRFVDVPGAQPEVTFGRRRGEPFRHVQLRSLTVSREHARLAREGKDWIISNLSQTNPIIVNGVTLSATDQRRVLQDGDRIEMGEVVFRYRGA